MADNTITVVGNLTRDPEIRYTASGQANARLGIAVSRRWQNRQTNEWEERTSFFNVVCWGDMAENVSDSIAKGTRVIVQRPARAAQLGDRAGREAQRRRDRRRRGRPEPALGDRRGEAVRASRWRRWQGGGGDFGGGGGGGRPAGSRPGCPTAGGTGGDELRRRRALLSTQDRNGATRAWHEIANGAARTRKAADRRRTPKKKVSILNQDSIDWVDYKDVNLLRRFMSERAKIRARRVTGNNQQQQREVARAIRVAREMALLPYSVRQVTQRSRSGRRDRGDRAGPVGADADAGCTAARRWPSSRRAARGRDDRRARGDRARRSARPRRRSPRPATGCGAGGGRVKVVLRDDVEKLGHKGDLLEVADGYARNYLVPRGLAIVATKGVVEQAAAMRRNRQIRDDRDKEAAQELATRARPPARSRSRRGPARAASCSARSRPPTSSPRSKAPDRRRARPAQGHARRAAQGARSGRGRRSQLHSDVTVTLDRRGRRRVAALRSGRRSAGRPSGGIDGRFARVVPTLVSHRRSTMARPLIPSPGDERGHHPQANSQGYRGCASYPSTGRRRDACPCPSRTVPDGTKGTRGPVDR